jgi:hypothetical protein
MALNSTHPQYDQNIEDWMLMRHAYAGERVVKAEGLKYLPPTPGMMLDGMDHGKPGFVAYEAYKMRAVFHDYVQEAVQSYIGLLHQKDATFELPAAMTPLLDRATNQGESMLALLRRINEQQLVTGRMGLLADLPESPDPTNPLPYITTYVGEAIINWDDSNDQVDRNNLNLVVMNESSFERQDDFVWKMEEKYRVLMLARPAVPVEEGASPAEGDPPFVEGDYLAGVFYVKDGVESVNQALMKTPMIRGKKLQEIPFFFVNSKDITTQPDQPPLLGLARLCMTMYRSEADYRQTLYLQGQDTLVVVGGLKGSTGDEPIRVGAGARIDVEINGDAKYIGTNPVGIPEQRAAIENDHSRAMKKAMVLASSSSKNGGGEQRASGEALRIRMAAQTATLMSIALSAGIALENLLKAIARWMGQDENAVKVHPNLQFADFSVDAKEYVDLMTARTMGAPISLQSIHALMVERGITKLSFEEEQGLISEEDAGRVSDMKKIGLGPDGALLPPPPPPPAPIAAPKPGNVPASA